MVPPKWASASQSTGGRRMLGAHMARDDGELLGDSAVRDRDACEFGPSNGGRHSGDDPHRDALLRAGEPLFAAPPEHERVAALEPDDIRPAQRVLDQQLVDAVLAGLVAAGELRDVNQDGVVAALVQAGQGRQMVVQHDVGLTQSPQTADGEQIRIPGAAADQHDASDALMRGRRRVGGLVSDRGGFIRRDVMRHRSLLRFPRPNA